MGYTENCHTCKYIDYRGRFCNRYPPPFGTVGENRPINYIEPCGEFKLDLEVINRGADKEYKSRSKEKKRLKDEIKLLKKIILEKQYDRKE